MGDDSVGVLSGVLTMLYDLMIRECSGCGAGVLVVNAVERDGPQSNWKTRKVYFKKSCDCTLWWNNRGDRNTNCPDAALFVFDEEPA